MADKKIIYWQEQDKLERPAYNALMKAYPLALDDIDGEEWRNIEGYEGYQVSNFGRVKSFKRFLNGKIVKPLFVSGYLCVNLHKCSLQKTTTIHRLVAETFIPNTDNKPQVNHRDGCKLNNYVGNLEWVTNAENMRHAVNMGLLVNAQGGDDSQAKLTNEQARYIRENPDKMTGRALAKKFAVNVNTISHIQLGRTYKNAGGIILKTRRSTVPADVREKIRAEYRKGSRDFGTVALGKKYGVDNKTIWKIVNEK